MHVDTDQFRAIRTEAYEVKALRRTLLLQEGMLTAVEAEAEQRGYKRGFRDGRTGRHARAKPGRHTHLKLVSGGAR